MSNKNILIRAIERKKVDKVPMMYRSELAINEKLIKYFGLKGIDSDWEILIEMLGADNFSDGETLSAFFNYFPKYIGPEFDAMYEANHFFIWGIKPVEMKIGDSTEIILHKNPPLECLDDISDVRNYNFPKMEWFDFDTYKVISDADWKDFKDQPEIKAEELQRSDKYFLNTFILNSLFMTSIFMRGFEKMLMDLLTNQKYAEALIGRIAQYMIDFHNKNLNSIGDKLDLYGIWDDFATQEELMISAEVWRKFYKPWDKKIIEIARKKNLFVSFHVCGNCKEIIPDLIEMGVDILDPVQVSAKDMDLKGLKKEFGKDICFHGGVDAQKLLVNGTPEKIREEVAEAKKIFDGDGGIILGPSHYITSDTPIENILAIYK